MRRLIFALSALLAAGSTAHAQTGCQDCVEVKVCCPPLTGDKNLLMGSFTYNQQPNETIAQHYGLTFAPAPALNTQLQLWTPFALNAYSVSGWTGVGVVMWADMRTDGAAPGTGPVNPSWPPTAADWTAGTSIQPNTPPGGPLGLWFSSGAPWIFSSTLSDATLPKPSAGAHMEANGRRYMIAVSYYIYEYEQRRKIYRLRKVCDGALVNIRLNVSALSARPGGGAKGMMKPPLEIAVGTGSIKAAETLAPGPELQRALDRRGQK